MKRGVPVVVEVMEDEESGSSGGPRACRHHGNPSGEHAGKVAPPLENLSWSDTSYIQSKKRYSALNKKQEGGRSDHQLTRQKKQE